MGKDLGKRGLGRSNDSKEEIDEGFEDFVIVGVQEELIKVFFSVTVL